MDSLLSHSFQRRRNVLIQFLSVVTALDPSVSGHGKAQMNGGCAQGANQGLTQSRVLDAFLSSIYYIY